MSNLTGYHAFTAVHKYLEVDSVCKRPTIVKIARKSLPPPSQCRRLDSLHEQPFSLQPPSLPNSAAAPLVDWGSDDPDTVLYLAYGSNLSAETFQGKRGIRPLSQVNVVVPDLVMTFDLAGLPYVEPCFANTRYRKSSETIIARQRQPVMDIDPIYLEKVRARFVSQPQVYKPFIEILEGITSEPETIDFPRAIDRACSLLNGQPDLLQGFIAVLEPKTDYHKNRWSKGLVGVVYEVTREDYAHIIATEGGGAGYQDVLVDCYELPSDQETVPQHPISTPFKAHTLYSPVFPPSDRPPKQGEHFSRPDPAYAQPSARYLKLITDGADQHALPAEYKDYLHQLRSYTPTTQRQRLGGWIFTMLWLPFITFIFSLNNKYADEDGKAPRWLVIITNTIFRSMWMSYDGFFHAIFGDGERTIDKEDDEDGYGDDSISSKRSGRCSIPHENFEEKAPFTDEVV